MSNEKGQVLIETTVSIFLIAASIKLVFFLFIFFWMKIWSEYNLSESIICRESQKSNSSCEYLFRQNFKKGQILFQIKSVVWKKTNLKQNAYVTLKTYLGTDLTFQKKIHVVDKP